MDSMTDGHDAGRHQNVKGLLHKARMAENVQERVKLFASTFFCFLFFVLFFIMNACDYDSLHEGVKERMEDKDTRVEDVVMLMTAIAMAVDGSNPGHFLGEYITSFKEAYGRSERTARLVQSVLEKLELEDDVPAESILAPQTEEDEDEDEDDKEAREAREKEERERLERERVEKEKEEARRKRESQLLAKSLARVKRRSAKDLSFMSTGLVDPSVSLRTNIVSSLKPHRYDTGGVKRGHP